MEIPWENTLYFSRKYKGNLTKRGGGFYVWKGVLLPADLQPYRTHDFSLSRWKEDEDNNTWVRPQAPKVKFTPRPHQKEAAAKIAVSYQSGWSGFILADKTGLGKTLSTLVGVSVIAKHRGFNPKNKAKLLIVCPKGVIPQWRQTLHSYPIATGLMRPLVINYQQLNKLLTTPAAANKAKKTKTKHRQIAAHGKPTIDWDFVVFDESHSLKNYPQSGASLAAVSIAKLNQQYVKDKSPFVVYSTATPGATPLNFAVMAQIMGPLLTNKAIGKKVTPDSWGEFLLGEGFAVKPGKVNWTWATVPWFGKNSEDPRERKKYETALAMNKSVQRRDTQRIGRALIKKNAPFIMRSPSDLAGWPEQQYIPMPIEMTPSQYPVYQEAWTRFRNWLKLTPAKSDPKGALVETLRYRQKASLLKVEQMVEQIAEWVKEGNQVFVSVEFIETLDKYKEGLEKKNIKVCEISGRNSSNREEERLNFQKGKAQVCLCTVVAGISLHSNEQLPDGTKATSKPRISVISDVRQNNLDTAQSCGRAHRDGENSLTYFPYLEDTVDQKIIDSFVNKQTNMNNMMGNTAEQAEEMERLFRDAAEKSKD